MTNFRAIPGKSKKQNASIGRKTHTPAEIRRLSMKRSDPKKQWGSVHHTENYFTSNLPECQGRKGKLFVHFDGHSENKGNQKGKNFVYSK